MSDERIRDDEAQGDAPRSWIDVPVLIVGAGPVGLSLATELGMRDVDCLLIDQVVDQESGINAHPRAAAVVPRTMEFCRRWGLAHQVHNSGFPRDFPHNEVACTSLDGHTISVQQQPSMRDREPLEFSPEIRERCPQIWFDPILENGLTRFPSVTVRRGWRLDSFSDHDSAAIAQVTDVTTGAAVTVASSYLIGCDGPASDVRTALGVPVSGEGLLSYSLNAVLEIPDFLSRHDKGPAERYYFIDPTGTWANLTVIDGQSRWRFTLTGTEEGLVRENVDLEAAIRRALGPNIPFEIVAEAPWRRRETIADHFKVGRVLLAGDAAHTIPPDLGMGMNTGVGDAVDLGWKLEATLKGWAGPALLDSYETERRPVAIRNARASTTAHQLRRKVATRHPDILVDGAEGEAARTEVGDTLVRMFPDAWDTNGLALGYRYHDSPICVPDGTPPPEADDSISHYVQTATPGARAPHAWLPDGRSTLDLFGAGFVLLRLANADLVVDPIVSAADKREVPLLVVDIDDGTIAELYEASLVLVRPDGHVAWRGNQAPADGLELIDRVRGAGTQALTRHNLPQDLADQEVELR